MARKSKFSDAEIIGFIKEIEAGLPARELGRRDGVSHETVNRWRATRRAAHVTPRSSPLESRPLETRG